MNQKQFHNDLKAAIKMGVPIKIGLPSDDLEHLESNDAAASNPSATSSERYASAKSIFAGTQSMVSVLDCLSVTASARRQVSKVLRRAFLYLFFFLLVAAWGLWLFTRSIAPTITAMREDLTKLAAINVPDSYDPIPFSFLLIKIITASLIAMMIWFCIGGITRLTMWMGGSSYVRHSQIATALRTIQQLFASGMEMEEAIQNASVSITDRDDFRAELKSIIGNEVTQERLHTLAEFHSVSARQRLSHLRVSTPMVLVSLFGGGFALLYCTTVFWPIASLIYDMTTMGT